MKLQRIPLLILTGTFLAAPGFLFAKHHTPTPTPADTATWTPTATPTTVPYVEQKLYTFDAMWGSKGTDLDQMNGPEGIDVSPGGKIFIADTGNNRILIWDADGKPITAVGSFGTQAVWRNPPQFNHPAGVFVHPSRHLYVADTENHRVVVLDEKGMVLSSWGTQGQANGQFNLPRGVAKDHFGNIWVLDSGNSRVEIFTGLGTFNSTWGSYGTDPTSNTTTALMNNPRGMQLNNIDQTIMADTGNFRLQVFNDAGIPVTAIGWYGDGPYQFTEPGDVAINKDGVIAVTDGGTGRVEFFNNRFEFIGQWKAKDEILNPNYKPRFRGIACDSENRLYITDVQNNAVIRLKPIKAQEKFTPIAPTPTPLETNPYGGVGYPIR